MGWQDAIKVALLVIRGVAWLVGNVKLFVKAHKLANPHETGWLQGKDDDDEFVLWRASGGLPNLAIITAGFTKEAALDDLVSGRLGGLSDVLVFGERDECIEWVLKWVDTDEHFIAACTSDTSAIEDIGRQLEHEVE